MPPPAFFLELEKEEAKERKELDGIKSERNVAKGETETLEAELSEIKKRLSSLIEKAGSIHKNINALVTMISYF